MSGLLTKWLSRVRVAREAVPLFSLCHTTARVPDGWRAAAEAWRFNCDNPALVEHILVTDDPLPETSLVPVFENTVFGLNRGRRCAVDGWNHSAALSRGRFLITVADDWRPCPHWDTELLKVIPDLNQDCVLEVDTGGNPGLLTFSMLTRSYYERYGYVFFPEYIGMYADNEFTDVARRDGVVIDARHLFFEHIHPLYGKGEMDEIHKWQHRPEAFSVGGEVYRRRRALLGFDPGFQMVPRAEMAEKPAEPEPAAAGPVEMPAAPPRLKVVVCLPGDHFSGKWVANWTRLFASMLFQGCYDVLPAFPYCSNVYMMRDAMASRLLKLDPAPDFVLWMDDDNALAPDQLARLMDTLRRRPELDVITGWCWTAFDDDAVPSITSVGRWGASGPENLTYREMMTGPEDVVSIDWSGFPSTLMRFEALKKAGAGAFAPISDEYFPWGYAGEDQAFFRRLGAAGGKVAVDRRVKVPHYRLRPAEPDLNAVREEKRERVA